MFIDTSKRTLWALETCITSTFQTAEFISGIMVCHSNAISNDEQIVSLYFSRPKSLFATSNTAHCASALSNAWMSFLKVYNSTFLPRPFNAW